MISDDDVRAALMKLRQGSRLPTSDGVYTVTSRSHGPDGVLITARGQYNTLKVSGPLPLGLLFQRHGKISDPWLPLHQLVKASLEYRKRNRNRKRG